MRSSALFCCRTTKRTDATELLEEAKEVLVLVKLMGTQHERARAFSDTPGMMCRRVRRRTLRSTASGQCA